MTWRGTDEPREPPPTPFTLSLTLSVPLSLGPSSPYTSRIPPLPLHPSGSEGTEEGR